MKLAKIITGYIFGLILITSGVVIIWKSDPIINYFVEQVTYPN
jgi:hypothetical protein